MPERKLIVSIVGDASSLNRSFGQASRSTKAFGRELTGTSGKLDATFAKFRGGGVAAGGAALFGGVAAASAIDQLNKAIDVASNLAEQTSKSRQVFAKASESVEAFATTAAESLGIARDQALEATGAFGNLFATVGLVSKDAGTMSTALVKLAADLASFNNASPEETLTALRSGLVGEAEPLRRFGVLLSEARVQQQAMTDTGKESAASLTAQEKVLARYELIMRDTVKAQGDFARTSDGLANSQRILSAKFRDSQANLGKLILPLKNELVKALVDATDAATALGNALGAFARIKIPPIRIPIVGEIGGGTGGDILRALFESNPPVALLKGEAALARKLGLIGGGPEVETDALGNISKATQAAIDAVTQGLKGVKSRDTISKGVQKTLDLIDQLGKGAQAEAFRLAALGQKMIDAENAAKAAEEARERQRDAFDALFARLSFGVDVAAATRGFGDDLRAFEAQEKAIRAQIKVEGRTVELERQLFNIEQERVNIARQRKEVAARQRQTDQFRALGLTAQGEKQTPTIANLQKQLKSLTARIAGTDLDTDANKALLAKIRKVLMDPLDKATVETRAKIKELFDTIRSGFEEGAGKGPLTKTSGLNTKKILEGLGLDAATENEIRSRLSGFNTAGRALAGGQPTTTRTTGAGTFGQPIVVQSTTNLILDGAVIARAVTRNQQKNRRRNPPQKRGPNRIGGV